MLFGFVWRCVYVWNAIGFTIYKLIPTVLHFMPWLNLDLLFKFHENSSCHLLTASIVVFLLDNLRTCIMCAFHLLDVICVAMKKSNMCCSLIDLRASLWLALGLGHLLCLRVTIWLIYSPLTTQIHALLFHWFTCPLLFGLHIDYCLVHVSPFYWFLCQLIRQVIYFKFRTNNNNWEFERDLWQVIID